MEEYKLSFTNNPQKRDYVSRFLFFIIEPKQVNFAPTWIKLSPRNNSLRYLENNCFSYHLLLNEDPNRAALMEDKFISELVRDNGKLRSINGLMHRVGRFKSYFPRA